METGLAKSKVHLVDPTYTPEQSSGCHLALQVRPHVTSFVIIEEERNVVVAAGRTPHLDGQDMSAGFSAVLQDDVFASSSFESVSLGVDGTPQTLVPQALFTEAEAHVRFAYGKLDQPANSHTIEGLNALLCYALPSDLESNFHKAYPQGRLHSAAGLFIQSLLRKNRFARGPQLFVEVNEGYASYFFMEGANLLLCNHFPTENEFDVLYHALNICQQHGAEANSVQVRMHGQVDPSHATLKLVKEHFSKVEINFGLDFQRMALGLSRLKKQHFASLFNQYVCVS